MEGEPGFSFPLQGPKMANAVFVTILLGVAASRAALLPTGSPDQIDWVKYYKEHGYGIGRDWQRGQFVPIYASPSLKWSVNSRCLIGPACPPPALPFPSMENGR
jgi:hypothetical protein